MNSTTTRLFALGLIVSACASPSPQVEGAVALFAHGHILRILTACWLGLVPDTGRLFALSTGSISTLGYERDTRVITTWNVTPPRT